MNILQVIPVFNPPELYGGSQQMVYQISRELVRRGHNVSVYTSDAKRSNLDERVGKLSENVEGISILHFRNTSSRLVRRIGFIRTPEMRETLEHEGENFDLIHVHEARGHQHIAVWRIARKKGLRYVMQAHGTLEEKGGLHRRMYDFIYGSRILKDASMNVALNEWEVEQYIAMGVPENRIVVIPNGVDLAEFSNLPPRGSFKKRFGLGEREKIVLYLGRIHKTKGIDILVRAFADIVKRVDHAKLVIVGPDDGFLRELKVLVRTLKIDDSVLILGPLYGEDKLEAYVDANVYVLPSRYEAFPVGILEAYACGMPVIASASDRLMKTILDRETSIRVTPGCTSEMGDALLLFLSGKAEFRSSRVKEFAKQFDIRKTVDRLEILYCKVTSVK